MLLQISAIANFLVDIQQSWLRRTEICHNEVEHGIFSQSFHLEEFRPMLQEGTHFLELLVNKGSTDRILGLTLCVNLLL